jgi:hypothetical protein
MTREKCPVRVVTSACGRRRQAFRKARNVPFSSRTTSTRSPPRSALKEPFALGRQQIRIRIGPRRQMPRQVGCGRDLGNRRGRCAAKLFRKHRPQKRQRLAPRRLPVDVSLALKRDSLPQHLQRAHESERDAVGIQVSLTRHGHHAGHQVTHQRGEVLVLATADVVVLLARARLTPERVPHRHLAGTGDVGVEIQLDQLFQRRHRSVLQPGDREHYPLFELRGQVRQRGEQHRVLRVEVKPDNARGEIRERDDLLHRGPRRTVDVQRRDAGIDESLPLPDSGGPLRGHCVRFGSGHPVSLSRTIG